MEQLINKWAMFLGFAITLTGGAIAGFGIGMIRWVRSS